MYKEHKAERKLPVLSPAAQAERPSRDAWTRLRHWLRLHAPTHIPIAYKLAFVITTLIVAGMSVLGLWVISNQTQALRNEADAFGQTVANQLAETAKEPVLAEDDLALQVLVKNLGSSERLLGAVVYSERGEVLTSMGVIPQQDIVSIYNQAKPLKANNFSFDWKWTDDNGQRNELVSFICPIQFKGLTVGHAVVTFSLNSMAQSAHDAQQAILIATITLSLLTMIAAFFMSKQISRPIYDLMDASREIELGNYGFRLNERRNDEIGTLMASFNDMANSLLVKSQVESALSCYVSGNIARNIMRDLDHVELGGKHVYASVLFADMVGFTQLSEKMPPEEVANFLNEYFSYISHISQLYRGTIDKFIGDCAMVVFGVPDMDPDHKFNSIACAIMIRRMTEELNKKRIAEGKVPVYFRMGINTGPMLAGNMGASDRMQYTVVGDAVNLASRLSSIANSDEIVVRDEHYNDHEVKRRVIARKYKHIKIRGKSEPITVFRVRDVATTYRAVMDRQIQELLHVNVYP